MSRNAYIREWQRQNPDKRRTHVLRHMYGITAEQYDEMVAEQDGVCAICGNAETWISNKTGKVSRLSVDHNHVTGDIRGFVCRRCNRVMGFVEDDPYLVRRILEYLEVRNETPRIVV